MLFLINAFNVLLFAGTLLANPGIARWSIVWLLYVMLLNAVLWSYFRPGLRRRTGRWRSCLRYVGWSILVIFPPGLVLVAFEYQELLPLAAIVIAVLLGTSCLYLADRYDSTPVAGSTGGNRYGRVP
jgi:hypothetical protein